MVPSAFEFNDSKRKINFKVKVIARSKVNFWSKGDFKTHRSLFRLRSSQGQRSDSMLTIHRIQYQLCCN